MFANYHTHTWRCNHATGTEREYVENAIAGGLKLLGFSDHTPYPFPEGTDIHTRMRLDQMDDYVDTVLALKKEYEKDIDIHLGLEVEYFPEYFGALLEFLKDYPIEYMILGQHFLKVGPEMDFVGRPAAPGQEEKSLVTYVDLCMEAMATGRFLYLAHPDLPYYTGDPGVYEKEMRRLCKAMKQYEIPAEINFLGIWSKRKYPTQKFWSIAAQENLKAVFGSDAHQADRVWDPETEKIALQYVERNDLELLEELNLQKHKAV